MSLVIWVIGTSINTILVPSLMFMQGLMIGSFMIGITACYRDKFLQQINLKKNNF